MPLPAKRKTSLTLDAAAYNAARDLGINVSAVAENALQQAVAQARRHRWLEEFAAQADWHERHDHPLAEIIVSPAERSWKS